MIIAEMELDKCKICDQDIKLQTSCWGNSNEFGHLETCERYGKIINPYGEE